MSAENIPPSRNESISSRYPNLIFRFAEMYRRERQTIALFKEVWADNIEEVKLLIDENSYLDGTNEDGGTVLHIAAIQGNLAMAELLMYVGKMNVNAKNKEGFTPLHFGTDQPEIIKSLLSNKEIIVDTEDNNGKTPLYKVIDSYSSHYYIDLEKREEYKNTLVKSMHHLIAHGADVQFKSVNKPQLKSPLEFAADKAPELVPIMDLAVKEYVEAKRTLPRNLR